MPDRTADGPPQRQGTLIVKMADQVRAQKLRWQPFYLWLIAKSRGWYDCDWACVMGFDGARVLLAELGTGLDSATGKPLKGFVDTLHDLGVATEDATGKVRPTLDVFFDMADKINAAIVASWRPAGTGRSAHVSTACAG